MRCSIVSRGLTLSQLQDEVKRAGGRNVKVATLSKQVFCDLDEAGLAKLKQVPGLSIKQLRKVTPPVVTTPRERATQEGVVLPVYAASQAAAGATLYDLRESFSPPLLGTGSTVCLLDSGVRASHISLRDKILAEYNFTSSPTETDVFGHGTSTAFMLAGGRHAPGEESGAAPGVKIISIKVLNDEGTGTEEEVVMGLEQVGEILQDAETAGLHRTDDWYPNGVNLSLGLEDMGDPDEPIRVACRELYQQYGIGIAAAAGNTGPAPQTIMCPACDPDVVAVGALTLFPLEVWYYSSRGPTVEGYIKPDFVYYGVDILLADNKSDEAFVTKSGTSFACPGAVGIVQLGWEGARRKFGEDYWEDWKVVQQWVPNVCVKPQAAPTPPPEKDTDYGWGMPYGQLYARALTGIPDISATIQMAGGLFALGMVGTMMSGVMKGLR